MPVGLKDKLGNELVIEGGVYDVWLEKGRYVHYAYSHGRTVLRARTIEAARVEAIEISRRYR